jgi:cadmium resistance protein CadD (predicted permease)
MARSDIMVLLGFFGVIAVILGIKVMLTPNEWDKLDDKDENNGK